MTVNLETTNVVNVLEFVEKKLEEARDDGKRYETFSGRLSRAGSRANAREMVCKEIIQYITGEWPE